MELRIRIGIERNYKNNKLARSNSFPDLRSIKANISNEPKSLPNHSTAITDMMTNNNDKNTNTDYRYHTPSPMTTTNNNRISYPPNANRDNYKDKILFYDSLDNYFEFTLFSPHGFIIDDTYWRTGQHYFQTQKYPKRSSIVKQIFKSATARDALKIGRDKMNSHVSRHYKAS